MTDFDQPSTQAMAQESDVWAALKRNVCQQFNEGVAPGDLCFTVKAAFDGSTVGDPDFLIFALKEGEVKEDASEGQGVKADVEAQMNEDTEEAREVEGGKRILVVGEAKTPWTLVFKTNTFAKGKFIADSWTLVEAEEQEEKTSGTNSKTMKIKKVRSKKSKSKQWGAKLGVHMRRAIAQTVGYMMDNGTSYGFLTTYTHTWFLHAVTWDEIEISDAIREISGTDSTSHKPSLLRAMTFVTSLARAADHLVADSVRRMSDDEKAAVEGRGNDGGGHGNSGGGKDGGAEGAGGGSGGVGEDGGSGSGGVGGSSSGGGGGGGGGSTTATTYFDALPVPAVFAKDIEVVGTLGQGRGGVVAAARWNATDIALKWFDLSKGRLLSLEKEAHTYLKLLTLKCRAAPKLLFKTVSPSGQTFGLGMEKGVPLPDAFSDWSKEQRSESDAVIAELETHGTALFGLYCFSCRLDSVDIIHIPCNSSTGVRHNDVRAANFVTVGGVVMAIDFEDVTFLQ